MATHPKRAILPAGNLPSMHVSTAVKPFSAILPVLVLHSCAEETCNVLCVPPAVLDADTALTLNLWGTRHDPGICLRNMHACFCRLQPLAVIAMQVCRSCTRFQDVMSMERAVSAAGVKWEARMCAH